jgi:hypothetical protein
LRRFVTIFGKAGSVTPPGTSSRPDQPHRGGSIRPSTFARDRERESNGGPDRLQFSRFGLRGSLLRVLAGLVAIAATAGMLRAQPPRPSEGLPPVPGAKVITLTPEPGSFTEPSIAVNPRNPQQIAAAYQDNVHAAYSFDGGNHWQLATGAAPTNYRVSGDVSVAYDSRGHALVCYIAFDKLGTRNYWAHNATRNGIFVDRSLDGGHTWESSHAALAEHPTEPGIPFEDKPYIVTDNTTGPYAGNIYVGWTRFTLDQSLIYFSRSTDGGVTWSAPLRISTVPGLPRDDNGSVEGFQGAVGPDSTLYVIWSDGAHIVFTSSQDGGKHFDPSRPIVPTAASYFNPDDVYRANGFPQIAIDPRGGALYVTWTDYRNGDIDAFASVSTDHGRTWSPAVRVNNDPIHNGADQFFQWLAVDPVTGEPYVLFYDRRGDPQNHKAIVALARSTDGGRTFENYAWTREAFDPQDVFIGDYTGLAAYNGCVYGIWTETTPKPAPTIPELQDPPGLQDVIKLGMARFPVSNGVAQACE